MITPDLDTQYRTRRRAVITAGTAAVVVLGLVAATGDRETVRLLNTVLSIATVLAVLNAGWWCTRRTCFNPPQHSNGAAALAAVLVVVSTVVIIISAVIGGNPL